MSKKNSTTTNCHVSSKREPLTNRQIECLVEIICRAGDEGEAKAKALLVLMDEIVNVDFSERGENIACIARRIAFSRCGDEAIEAQAELLRGLLTYPTDLEEMIDLEAAVLPHGGVQ